VISGEFISKIEERLHINSFKVCRFKVPQFKVILKALLQSKEEITIDTKKKAEKAKNT